MDLPHDALQTKSETFEPAGFFRRWAATILDSIILLIVTTLCSAILKFVVGVGIWHTVLSFLVQMVVTVWYFGHFYSTRGASPGKELLDLEVRDSKTHSYVSFKTAALRETIGKTFSALIFMVGYLMALFNEENAALHDKMFGTRVVKVK